MKKSPQKQFEAYIPATVLKWHKQRIGRASNGVESGRGVQHLTGHVMSASLLDRDGHIFALSAQIAFELGNVQEELDQSKATAKLKLCYSYS